MYHAVMGEVVRFLERCHNTLNAAVAAPCTTTTANKGPSSMPRSKSVNHVFVPNDTSSLLNEPIGRISLLLQPSSHHNYNANHQVQQRQQRNHLAANSGRKHINSTLQMMMNSFDENLDRSHMSTGRTSEPLANFQDLTWYVLQSDRVRALRVKIV